MPNKIYEFKNIEEAKKRLSKFNKNFVIKYEELQKSLIINDCVKGNVYRAFRGKPSVILRKFLNTNFEKILKDYNDVYSRDSFDNYVYNSGICYKF